MCYPRCTKDNVSLSYSSVCPFTTKETIVSLFGSTTFDNDR